MGKITTASRLGLVLACCLGHWGCAGKLTAWAAGNLVQDVAQATAKHDDMVLVGRAAPTFLLLMEGLLESNPGNSQLLLGLCEGYVSYGTLVEAEDPQRARALYKRAMDYGRQALAKNKKIGPLLDAPYGEFVGLEQYLKDDQVAQVFWAASSWGAWISLSTDSMAALAQLPKVIYLMEWILERDETFFNGSPHVFLGVYHAALPPMLGGNPEKSRAHFERARQLSQGQVLMVDVQMARFYARQIFDRDLYVQLLEQVVAAPLDQPPELTLQNTAAQAMARKLLNETDDFF
ncbi:MAG: hypothetical protein GKR89_09350 [Candidatus Latescibacteria bacterium]|nr:hypothetical protein [Candidatus Latescibacterota bacterium]